MISNTIDWFNPGGIVHYRITAVDEADNVSDYSNSASTKAQQIPKSALEPAVSEYQILPKEFAVEQNFPNPFNPTTNIRFALPDAAHVSVKIYNLLGEEIRTLVNGGSKAGFHAIRWDGKDGKGKDVPSGIYIYRVEVHSTDNGTTRFTQSRKMTLLH